RMYWHAILLRIYTMRWNKGMGGVLSNGWNDELVKALHTFEANGTDGCLISQSIALSIITHVGLVHPDRYDEGVFQRRCLNSGAANYHYLVLVNGVCRCSPASSVFTKWSMSRSSIMSTRLDLEGMEIWRRPSRHWP
ncbi:hypothetical protein EV363DRAFT_1160488, partial [Boletus edulis]